MTQLIINNKEVELNDNVVIDIIKNINDINNPSAIKTDVSRSISLPRTKQNDLVFDFIGRVDRTSKEFNVSKKYNYVLLIDGNIISKGYIKINEITISSININLFSQEAEFFKLLGDKKVIDLKFENITNVNSKLLHKLNRHFIYNNFYKENGEIDNYIKYVPMFKGTYANFDSKKIQVPKYTENGEIKTTKDLPYEFDEWTSSELRPHYELRAINQTPSIYLSKLIDQIFIENDYKLHSDFLTKYNPYYSKVLLLTKLYSETKIVDGEILESKFKVVNPNYSITPNDTNITGRKLEKINENSDPNNFLTQFGYLDLSSAKDLEFDIDAEYSITFEWQGMDNPNYNRCTFNKLSGLKHIIGISNEIASFENNPQQTIEWGGNTYKGLLYNGKYYFTNAMAGYMRTFNVSLRNLKAKSFGELISQYTPYITTTLSNNMNVIPQRIDGATIAGTNSPITKININFNRFNINVRKISDRALDNNITIDKLFSSDLTQKDLLLEYCKLFGLYISVEDKNVYITTRNYYYQDKVVKDWTNKVDLNKDVIITPLNFNKKYLEYGYKNDTTTNFLKYFKNKYNKNYGSKIINTGYEFDESTDTVFNKSIFYPIVPCSQSLNGQRITMLSSFDLDNNIRKGKENKLSLIFDCEEYNTFKTKVYITDESSEMVIEDKYYWNNDNAYKRETKIDNGKYLIPKFMNITSDYTKSLDISKPNETLWDINDTLYQDSATLFDKFQKEYVIERYNIDTKILKLYVKLNKIEKLKLKPSDFIYYQNKLWTINNIEYDLMSDESCKVELISINNISAYSNSQEEFNPELQIVTESPLIISYNDTIYKDIDILTNGVDWEIINVSNTTDFTVTQFSMMNIRVKANNVNNSPTPKNCVITIRTNNFGTKVEQTILVTQNTLTVQPHQLTLNPSNIEIMGVDNGIKTISVESNKGWRVVGQPSWITYPYGDDNGNGNGTIRFLCEANNSVNDRNGTIVVVTYSDELGSLTKYVNITQKGGSITFKLSADNNCTVRCMSLESNYSNNSRTLTNAINSSLTFNSSVSANYEFDGWYINSMLYSKNSSITYAPQQGDSIYGTSKLKEVVSQEEHKLEVSPESFILNTNNNLIQTINVTSNKGWRVVGKPSWLNIIDNSDNGINNGTIRFIVDNNNGNTRKGTIVIATYNDNMGSKTALVSIEQN